MAKFGTILIIVGVIITVQALPPTYDEILAAARDNQWDQVQELLRTNFAKTADFKTASFDGVRSLKPVDGGHVYGEAEYSFHTATNVNGKTTEDHAGHKVVNDDGKVKEFDFTPKAGPLPLIPPINPQSQFGNAFSASDNSFQYTPSSASLADHSGDNNVIKIGQHHIPNLSIPPQSFSSIQNQGAQGGNNAFNSQYSYSHSNSFVNGKPVDLQGGLVNAENLFPDAQKTILSPLTFTNVRDLKPPQGGKVFGEAEYSYHTSSNINGKVSEDQGGHKIINDNGRVQEFDFTPSPNKSPVVSYFS